MEEKRVSGHLLTTPLHKLPVEITRKLCAFCCPKFRSASKGRLILTAGRCSFIATKMVWWLVVQSLVVAIFIAAAAPHCYFDDGDCVDSGIVVDLNTDPGLLAVRNISDRTKVGNASVSPEPSDGNWGIAWVTSIPHPDVDDRPPKAVSYPPRANLSIESVSLKVPLLPPKSLNSVRNGSATMVAPPCDAFAFV